MSLANMVLIRRLYEEIWNQRRLEIVDELVSESHALSTPQMSGAAVGPEAYKRQITRLLTAFPDLQLSLDDIVSEKDKLVVAWTISGTHKGGFEGIPATGKKISFAGVTIHQIANGKILDSMAVWDELGLLRQMGVELPTERVKHQTV